MDATENILAIFAQISAVPRCSGREAQIAGFMKEWAVQRGFARQTDPAGNLLIRVPASPGFEDRPGLILQAHLDMVCEKTPDSEHDFSQDPLQLYSEDGWLRARGTTLGADNGIGLALALALAEDESALHPPLELLFTVEEEVGLAGANKLAQGWLQGTRLINLDAEEEGVFLVGCAGGRLTRIELGVEYEQGEGKWQALLLEVSGLQGGHSGTDIHKGRASAVQLLGRILHRLQQVSPLRLSAVQGGTAHNAIARQGRALLLCPAGDKSHLLGELNRLQSTLRSEHPTESALSLSLTEWEEAAPPALSVSASARSSALLAALPHGVAAMSNETPGFVETSCNLARVELDENGLRISVSQRSTVQSRLDELTGRIEAIAALAGANFSSTPGNRPWQPNLASPLLEICRAGYRRLYDRQPQVKMIHAGLECGVIGAKYPGLDMISIGPTAHDAHSPNERLHISSVGKVYALLKEIAASG